MDTVYTRATETQKPFLKDPGSAITHFIGVVAAASEAAPLLVPGLIGQEIRSAQPPWQYSSPA